MDDFRGRRKILNIFPSIDTGVCAASIRHFNAAASNLTNTDLPFAHGRFCVAEGIKNCETLSTFRNTSGKDLGILLTNSPLAGLLARAIVVLSEENVILYTELVSEISQEPDYASALKVWSAKTHSGGL